MKAKKKSIWNEDSIVLVEGKLKLEGMNVSQKHDQYLYGLKKKGIKQRGSRKYIEVLKMKLERSFEEHGVSNI
jgi:hypothetical protein